MTTPPTTTSTPVLDLRTVLDPAPRPPRPGAIATALTIGHRSLLKIKHVPEQLTDVLFIPILFTLMFTYLFGGALAGSTGDYLQFLLPGTLVMTIILLSTFTGSSFHVDLTSGVFDRFRSLPIWQPAPIVGTLLGDAGRNLLSAVIVICLGLIMGYRPEGGAVGVLLAVALLLVFAAGLAWAWLTVALAVRSLSAVTSISLLIVFPLSFASNVFVDPTTMPGWLQAFVAINPVSRMATASRGLMSGQAVAADVIWVLVAAVVLTAVFAPTALHLYRRRG